MPGSGGPEEPGTTTEESCSAPVPGLRWRRVFPGEDRQLSVLRRWLAALLSDGPLRDDVTAIASELAGNAIVHTASDCPPLAAQSGTQRARSAVAGL
jgi:hypothetical protein